MHHSQIKVDELRNLRAFECLNNHQLECLADYMVRRTYTPGQMIFLEGDMSIGLWFIVEGKVKIIKQSTSGRLQGLCLMNPGKCFGSCPLFDTETNPADAQALDAVTLAMLPREGLQLLIQQDHTIAMCLLQVYNERIGLLARLGECLGTWPVAMRINDCLIAHAKSTQREQVVELTHEELASLAGTVREVVTRHLSQLEAQGAVQTASGQITLLDLDTLQGSCIAGDSPYA